jgi:hypothetical protein
MPPATRAALLENILDPRSYKSMMILYDSHRALRTIQNLK